MSATARDEYLKSQVFSATPQKLHLMLIDGATASLQTVADHWEQPESEPYLEQFSRAQRIVGEMLAAVCEGQHALSKQLVPLYTFLFTTVTTSQLRHDRQKLEEAQRLLATERETWAAACEKFGSVRDLALSPDAVQNLTAIPTPPPADLGPAGLSLEA